VRGVPRQNRVTPLGEIIAHEARGLVYGNRGCLHDEHGRIRRRYAGKLWISCRLEFKGRRRELMQPGRYTELFFLDEATAFAAGHRPCAECRRADYTHFLEVWPGEPRAPAVNDRLQVERLSGHHEARCDQLPDGVFVVRDGAPWLVRGDGLLRWTPAGYDDAVPRPGGTATVVTPPSLVTVLANGWRPTAVPFIHPSGGPPNATSLPSGSW
jgi:hypothetical protein